MTLSTIISTLLRNLATLIITLADWIHVPKKKRTGIYAIKNRKVAHDVWLTPEEVAKDHIGCCYEIADECSENDKNLKWVDPFRNTGIYFNNFYKGYEKDWCEILEGRDALEYDYKDAVICSNPPYSLITKLLKKMTKDKARVISILGMTNHITTPRLKMMEDAGYKLVGLQFYNVKGYMMTATAMTWVRDYNEDTNYKIEFQYKRGGFDVDHSDAMR